MYLGLCDPGFPQHRWKWPGFYNQSKLEITEEGSEETLQEPAGVVKSVSPHFDNCMWVALGWRAGSWVISIHSARSCMLSASCVHVLFLSSGRSKGQPSRVPMQSSTTSLSIDFLQSGDQTQVFEQSRRALCHWVPPAAPLPHYSLSVAETKAVEESEALPPALKLKCTIFLGHIMALWSWGRKINLMFGFILYCRIYKYRHVMLSFEILTFDCQVYGWKSSPHWSQCCTY